MTEKFRRPVSLMLFGIFLIASFIRSKFPDIPEYLCGYTAGIAITYLIVGTRNK